MDKGKEALEGMLYKGICKLSRVMIGKEGPELTIDDCFRKIFKAHYLSIAIEEPKKV